MLKVRDRNASTLEARKQNISSWQDADTTRLNAKAKKRFSKFKSAIVAYFTSDKPIKEITTQYNLSAEQLLNMAANCLKQHKDGSLWGFRALLPGVLVKDYSSISASVQAEAKSDIINDAPPILESSVHPTNDNDTQETTAKCMTVSVSSAEAEQPAHTILPVQSSNDSQNQHDYMQNPQSEAALISLEDSSEAASGEVESGNTISETREQSEPTQPLTTETIRTSDIEISNAPFDNTNIEVPEIETEVAPDHAEPPEVPGTLIAASETSDSSADHTDIVSDTNDVETSAIAPGTSDVSMTQENTVTETNNSEALIEASGTSDVSVTQEDAVAETNNVEAPIKALGTPVIASDAADNMATEEPDVTSAETITADSEAELPSSEYPTIQAESILPDTDSSPEETLNLQQENTHLSESLALLLTADSSVEPSTPGENEVTTLAIINDSQSPTVQDTRVVLPPPSVETKLASPFSNFLLPKYTRRSTHASTTHMAQRRRMVHKRWTRDSQDKTKRQRVYRTVSIAIVSVILLSLLVPIGVGLAAYNAYNNVNGIAHDGINHLMTVKNLLPTSKNDITSVLNATKLQNAQLQLKAAETDFVQLQQLADRPDIQSIVDQVAPQYSGKLGMAKHLLQVALDVSRMGQELTGVGVIAANIIHTSPLAASSTKPLISVGDVENIKAAITHALYYMNDIQQNMSQVQLKDLPVSAKQQAQLTSVLAQLPSIRSLITQNQSMVDIVTWLLGVGQSRRLLIQTMDTGELRSGGGFTGQYGILNIENGHVPSFSLHDVNDIDYHSNGMIINRLPPSQYSWMNFGNWGIRDSNLSADYPTTAQINMQLFQEQGGGPVDGVIDFTPAFIGHIIDATGPIHVTEYNETITSSNLVEKLHYYQQNFSAIGVEQQKTNDTSSSVRKAFTTLLGKLLLSRVTHLPTTKLLALVKNAIKDIQSRDLEIYLANPAAEQWLVNNGYSDGMSTFRKQDGFMVVQSNMSISKASQYVHTTEHDDITLDAQGGATHNLTVTLHYNQTGPVYGFDTYSDYMRIYTPQSSQFISGDGFDTGQPACAYTPPVQNGNINNKTLVPPPPVSTCNSLPASETLNCPNGDYSLGTRAYNMPKTADIMGAPTAKTSDLPGRGMFGGMTVTPKNCISTILLSWYVPNAVKHVGKNLVYPFLVQKQGGLVPTLQIAVDASAVKGMKPFSFQGDIHADRVFNIR